MKGIILAGGSGTRLYPLTKTVSKQMLPVYDKPMIFYPLSTLMLAGIREVLIISTPTDTANFQGLLGDGSKLGMKLEYAIQQKPEGLAQAFLIGKEFIGDDSCAMVLGDNIFYGNGLYRKLKDAVKTAEKKKEAMIFGYYVTDPERFGVVEFDKNGKALSIEEKPKSPKSHYAVVGLYFYPPGVTQLAKKVTPSVRGELEITTLNQMYLDKGILNVELFGRGFTWFDCGTMDSLLDAGSFVRMMEQYQGIKLSVPEEIACRNRWITREEVTELADDYGKSAYAKHLQEYVEGQFV
ncbi:MAG: glucose-1-phosphate thymidylyltransferase RfbA [Clostridiales bacterium]|nr:glucose-1-phosphate thymidylyltransferase RfbA [Clostridiales bacterium]